MIMKNFMFKILLYSIMIQYILLLIACVYIYFKIYKNMQMLHELSKETLNIMLKNINDVNTRLNILENYYNKAELQKYNEERRKKVIRNYDKAPPDIIDNIIACNYKKKPSNGTKEEDNCIMCSS
jgi:hypothetical protein